MSKEQNGKINGKAEEKVIPAAVWKEFYEYWDSTEWKDLTKKDIQKHLGDGKYVFVEIPTNVKDKIVGTAWFQMMKSFKEKNTGGFGSYRINFAGQTATLESVFGDKPIDPATMTKQLHLFINDHHLSSKAVEPKVETNTKTENNDKKTVNVNSVSAMEKAVETIKPKKGKK